MTERARGTVAGFTFGLAASLLNQSQGWALVLFTYGLLVLYERSIVRWAKRRRAKP